MAGAELSRRPVGNWGFAGFAITSVGGPLALAALIVPAVINANALMTLAGTVVFGAPLLIWLRCSEHVTGSGGLYAIVEAAAGRRIALLQAAVWTVSYLLYVIYTSVQVVDDVLGAVLPSSRPDVKLLLIVVPAVLVLVVVSGRRSALLVAGLIAAVQVALVLSLDAVTLAHLPLAIRIPHGSDGTDLLQATGQSALLYICASLPLFLGGELGRPSVTIRRGITGAVAFTAVVTLLAVLPLTGTSAAAGQLLHAPVPGMAVIDRFSGHTFAVIVGIGIALSVAGVMLIEYVALTRLLHAVSGRSVRQMAIAIGAVVLAVAPFTLHDPDGFYDALIKPSLAALWISQLIVFAVYPRFARRYGQPLAPAWALSLISSALALYGLYVVFSHPSS